MSSDNGHGPSEAESPGDPDHFEGERRTLRLGGMALRNGLLIHGPTSWAAAARGRSGEIEVASGAKPVIAPALAAKIPLLRGPLKLAEAFVVIPIVRTRLRSARLPFEDPRVLGAMVAASAASRAIRNSGSSAQRELAQAVLGLAPALVALGNRDLAAYHGAEHKAIGAYEAGSEDAAAATKEHERCGSNLVAPMLIMSVAGQLLLERVVEEPGPLARSAVGLAGVSLAVEMFAWSDRNPDTAVARAFHRPGHEIQRLIATKEPSAEQLDVGVAALREILRAEAAAEADGEQDAGRAAPVA